MLASETDGRGANVRSGCRGCDERRDENRDDQRPANGHGVERVERLDPVGVDHVDHVDRVAQVESEQDDGWIEC